MRSASASRKRRPSRPFRCCRFPTAMRCRLLSALKGPVAPEDWRGALAITYHVGPGPARVHLKVSSNWDIKPVYDVIATLHGSTDEGQWVIRGNHHDAWVNGADDPISGPGRDAGGSARAWANCTPRAGDPGAPSSTAHGTARNPDCWVRSNGSRRMSMSCEITQCSTSIPTATSAAFYLPVARRICRISSAA